MAAPDAHQESIVLLRTTTPDDRCYDFAGQIEAASGLQVVLLVDERAGPVDQDPRYDKIGVTEDLYRGLGLFLPQDFAWRCGDYGYHAGRLRYPDARFLWLIEYDV